MLGDNIHTIMNTPITAMVPAQHHKKLILTLENHLNDLYPINHKNSSNSKLNTILATS